jgi:hypothetical protein
MRLRPDQPVWGVDEVELVEREPIGVARMVDRLPRTANPYYERRASGSFRTAWRWLTVQYPSANSTMMLRGPRPLPRATMRHGCPVRWGSVLFTRQ